MKNLNEEILSITLKYPDEASEEANKELQEKWDKFGVTSGDVLTVNQSELKGTDDKYYLITKIEKSPDIETTLLVRASTYNTNIAPESDEVELDVKLVVGKNECMLNA